MSILPQLKLLFPCGKSLLISRSCILVLFFCIRRTQTPLMKISTSKGFNSVHHILIGYQLVFFSISFLSYLIYFLVHDAFWFQAAYATNIGALLMAFMTTSAILIDNRFNFQNEAAVFSLSVPSVSSKLIAYILFTTNAVILRNEWTLSHPQAYSAIWITAIGLFFLLYSEFSYLSQLIKEVFEKAIHKSLI